MPAARGQSIRLAMPARTEASYACQKEHSCCWFRDVRKSSIGTHRSAARRGARIDLPCERSNLGLYRRQTAKRAQKEASLSPRVLPKTAVQFENNALSVDAAVIGQGLGLSPLVVQASIRDGKLTAVCERGIEADAGRYRLSFFLENRRFPPVVDENGNAIQHSTDHFGSTKFLCVGHIAGAKLCQRSSGLQINCRA